MRAAHRTVPCVRPARPAVCPAAAQARPGGSPVTAASGSSGGSAPPANARSLTSPVQVPHAEQGPFAAAAHAPAGPNSDNARPLLSPADMARMRAGSTICTTPPPDLGRFGMGHVGNDSSDEEEVRSVAPCLAAHGASPCVTVNHAPHITVPPCGAKLSP
eukprot:359062-Chlamydomonas_euryale.AAC.4